ncbi:MAG: ATP-binding protein [Deltaproteobacteria bacterium]|nr:ATP-binding protein [Deltaproteobacteria bacterium]
MEQLREELERCRSMLIQSAKLADLGQEVASLAHEVAQPLLAIKAFAQMLKAQLEADEGAQRRAAFIEEQAIVLEQLVVRLRNYARQSIGEADARADLPAVVESVLMLVDHRLAKARVDVQVSFPDEVPLVALDPVRGQQLLVNLLTNAADAVEGQDDRRVLVVGKVEPGRVKVYVVDSGPGIPEEVRAKILEPFFTTKGPERGTGLGLPIVKEILDACGGGLEILSASEVPLEGFEGMGTAMVMDIPLAEPEA